MAKFYPVFGRLLIAAIFLLSGLGKIADPIGTRYYMTAFGMPMVEQLLVAAIILELGGGMALLLGWKVRWAVLGLLLFLIPATLIFHSQLADRDQMQNFMKNLGLIGGL